MNASLLTRTKGNGQLAARRLGDVSWAIVQASSAAGLAWYIAHDLLGHSDPFFAPITAAVTLSASNVFHAQRVIQNICGVALGISLGAAVQLLLGNEWIAMSGAVFAALSIAVLIGHGFLGEGLTFANQTAGSAVLVMAITGGDRLFERLQEAMIGGGLALAMSLLLFPGNPVEILRAARVAVLDALKDALGQPDRILPAADRVHERLDDLIEARYHARLLARFAPLRRNLRAAVESADRQAAELTLLAGSVLHLARAAAPENRGAEPAEPVREAIGELAAGLNDVEGDVEAASAHARAACGCAASIDSTEAAGSVLADVVTACAEDLQRVIDLRP
ncbi:FUSC family protein [Mycobacterium camsae]|uniref:FUSC family protein n=1 Tax=Mycobacterium gordonae TaxID=1778 RepID=UPI0019822FEF|nr:FUSC family protein [Mycobacterium gordonae]